MKPPAPVTNTSVTANVLPLVSRTYSGELTNGATSPVIDTAVPTAEPIWLATWTTKPTGLVPPAAGGAGAGS